MGRAVFLTLWDSVRNYRGRILAAVVFLVAAKLATVAVPMVLKRIVDAFSRPEQVLILPAFLLLAYAVLRFAGTLFGELRDLVFARVSRNTVAGYTEQAFAHLHRLSARFHARRQTGAITRDVERGTVGIGFLLGVGLFTIVPTLVEIGFVMAIMLRTYSDWFTGIIGVTFIVYAIFTVTFTARREIYQRRINELDSRAQGYVVDSLLNAETVKIYANEAQESSRLQGVMRDWIDTGIRNQGALSLLHVGQSGIIAVGVAAIMLLAGQEVVHRTMTVGDLVLINAYVIQVCLPLNALGFVFRETRDAMVNVEKLFHLLGEQPEIADPADGKKLVVGAGEVLFDHVNFAYEANRPILQDIELRVPPGAKVAVVGGSGSGKSTLARLLLRLYDVQDGRIAIDGQDIRLVTQKSLRDAIGVVPQDTTLFNQTIGYNIGYGRLSATLPEIIEAARMAQVHDFIAALPEQYETIVGERGVMLSGGEKQRIAIARAILKNPPILIFDEATSALDARSERAIQAELNRLAKNRTTLIIAHRLSTIVDADQIVVMERGRIVERGGHEELLARQGLYAQMWSLQQQERELERTERRMALQPINLVTKLANVIDALRPEIDARSINLYTTMAAQNARVSGDPTLLAQLFGDLARHAVAVSPVGGRVEIDVLQSGGEAVVRIADSADMASADGLVTHATPDSVPDFTRLQSIAEQHRGRLAVDRRAGQGSTYTVSLPLRAVAELERLPRAEAQPAPGAPAVRAMPPGGPSAPAGAVPAPPQADVAGLQIIVVDDQEDAREVLAEMLEMHGAQVQTLARGEEVVRWFEHHPPREWPDLLLCDIGLPDRDGYAVIRAIRALEAMQHVDLRDRMPAIALTGYSQSEDRMRALLAGFQLHLAKPVNAQELLTAVASMGRSTRRQPH